jgi:hypothetical protein
LLGSLLLSLQSSIFLSWWGGLAGERSKSLCFVSHLGKVRTDPDFLDILRFQKFVSSLEDLLCSCRVCSDLVLHLLDLLFIVGRAFLFCYVYVGCSGIRVIVTNFGGDAKVFQTPKPFESNERLGLQAYECGPNEPPFSNNPSCRYV